MPKTTLIYNPLAGPVNLASKIESVAEKWRTQGWEAVLVPTQAAGHASQLAQQAAAAGHELVFAIGGDGTLGEVANGLAGTETVMAPVPTGTANSFAKELRLPQPTWWHPNKLLETADILANGRVQRMDLGYAHSGDGKPGHFWLLWAGIGVDGFLVHQIEPRPKWSKKLGTVGYIMQGLATLPRLPTMKATVTVDNQVYEDHFTLVLISNCRLYAGRILLNPTGKLDDGLFEVWLWRGQGVRQVMRQLFQAMRGRHEVLPSVTMVNGRHITVQATPALPCQTDGDKAGCTPLHFEMKPGALRLLVPATAPPGLFSQPGAPLL